MAFFMEQHLEVNWAKLNCFWIEFVWEPDTAEPGCSLWWHREVKPGTDSALFDYKIINHYCCFILTFYSEELKTNTIAVLRLHFVSCSNTTEQIPAEVSAGLELRHAAIQV